MFLTRFSSLLNTTPVDVIDISNEELIKLFQDFATVSNKDDPGVGYVGFYRLKAGTTRRADNVEQITALVLDFDNLHETTVPEDLIPFLQKENFFYLYYSTISATKNNIRWRLVIPFESGVTSRIWRDIFPRCLAFLKFPGGVDSSSGTVSQVFRMPCAAPNTYKLFGYHNGVRALSLRDLPSEAIRVDDFSIKTKSLLNVSEVWKVLSKINPDDNYEQWFKTGMALKSEFGESGYSIWLQWSAKGAKFGGESEIRKKWYSFKGSGTTLGSIIYFANHRNYETCKKDSTIYSKPQPVPSFYSGCHLLLKSDNRDEVSDSISGKACEKGNTEARARSRGEDEEETREDPGLNFQDFGKCDPFDLRDFPFLQSIFSFYESRSIRFCPNLALGATINIASLVLQNLTFDKIRTRPNIYSMLIGAPGAGKQKIIDITTFLLRHFDLEKQMVRNIGTVQGIEKHLINNQGKVFILLDETQDFFKTLHSKNVSEHKAGLLTFFKESFGGHIYSGAITKGSEKVTIDKLIVNCCLLGVPNTFRYLNLQDFNGGLMSRFLFFREPKNTDPIDYSAMGIREDPFISTIFKEVSFPKTVHFPKNCMEFMMEFQKFCYSKQESLDDSMEDNIIRLPELTLKLALLTANQQGQVTYKSFLWASSVVIQSFNTMVKLIQEHFYYGEYSDQIKKFETLLKKMSKKGKVMRVSTLRAHFSTIRTNIWLDLLQNGQDRNIFKLSEELMPSGQKRKILIYKGSEKNA
jgi:hypothetical protein